MGGLLNPREQKIKVVKVSLLAFFSKREAEEKTEPEKHMGGLLNPREVKEKSCESFFDLLSFQREKRKKKRSRKNIWEGR